MYKQIKPVGKVKDWTEIYFNKNESNACITCAPGSAAVSDREKSFSTIVSEKPADSIEKTKKPTTLALIISSEIQTIYLTSLEKNKCVAWLILEIDL